MKRIIIVDDDQEFLNEISELLNNAGYETLVFNTGDEALKAAQKEIPDVIILDLKLQDGSGFKTANELKNIKKTANIPLIAMTGIFTDKELLLIIKSCGFKQCLTKPINPLDMIETIETVINVSSKK